MTRMPSSNWGSCEEAEAHGLADVDRPGCRRQLAGQDLEQRRLADAVLADDGVGDARVLFDDRAGHQDGVLDACALLHRAALREDGVLRLPLDRAAARDDAVLHVRVDA